MSRILVIDDDSNVTQLLEEFLTGEGHEVTVSHSGLEGFKKAVEMVPDLILQDVMLPDATGFQMVDRIRGESTTSTVPIIMMSGAARHASQKQLGNMMGANDYVLKPFDIDDMDRRIKRLLSGEAPPMDVPAPRPITPSPFITRFPEAMTEEPPAAVQAPAPKPIPMRDWTSSPAPATATVPTPNPSDVMRSKPRVLSLVGMFFILALHLILTNYLILQQNQPWAELLLNTRRVLCSWGLVLGLLTLVSALTRVTLVARSAARMLGWSMIPWVVRASMQVLGIRSVLDLLPSGDVWVRSLDIFELTTMILLGMALRWQPGGSMKKSILAIFLLGSSWIILGRQVLAP